MKKIDLKQRIIDYLKSTDSSKIGVDTRTNTIIFEIDLAELGLRLNESKLEEMKQSEENK